MDLSSWLKNLQMEICSGLEELDTQAKFEIDNWKREEGGGGRSCVLQNGKVFEKAGVNFSHVHGKAPRFLLTEEQHSIFSENNLEWPDFSATGVSIVIHPINPWVPIIHMNIRYFEMSNGIYWYGGGIDLTPHYFDEDQRNYFHGALQKMCDAYHPDFYPEFSKWADEYFYLPHRGETRGIGGIFFDRLTAGEKYSRTLLEEFWKATGKTFFPLYKYHVLKTYEKPFTPEQQQWQLIRRGRYVEFNLVYDKGTRFGLETGGRIESILMSLPQHASWYYDYRPQKGSAEEQTLQYLRRDIGKVVNH